MQKWQKVKVKKWQWEAEGKPACLFRQGLGLVQTADAEEGRKTQTPTHPPRNNHPLANSLCQTWTKKALEVKSKVKSKSM